MTRCQAVLIFVGFAVIARAAAQAPQAEAQSHVFSAFISGADPRVLAAGVKLGPALRAELGADADGPKVYDALVERASGAPLRVRPLTPAEAAGYAALVGGNFADPLLALQAGELVLLLQYATKEKNVAFVELLSAPAARAAVRKPQPEAPPPAPEAPKPPPVVAVPLPAAPAAPPVERQKPPAPVVVKPKPQPVAVQKPAPPAPAPKAKPAPPKPRGECVVKPVMSEEDMWNCSAPAQPAAIERPAPPVAAQKPPPAAAPATPKPRGECVIKPVMSDEELRACGVRR